MLNTSDASLVLSFSLNWYVLGIPLVRARTVKSGVGVVDGELGRSTGKTLGCTPPQRGTG